MSPRIPPAGAEIDFETYSEAGFVWDAARNKWTCLNGAPSNRKGLPIVGAPAYTEHPSAEVLTCSYRIHPGPTQRWRPGDPLPMALFEYLRAGGTLEAHNVMFEYLVWTNICERKYGWPPLAPHVRQLRCSMAKARVNSFPGKLGPLGDVLQLTTQKDKDGTRLLNKFSIPRDPTKGNPALRIRPEDDPADFERLQAYCDTDLDAEHGASNHPRMQAMTLDELEFWLIDQEINRRGIAIDREGVRNCIAILREAQERYSAECRELTNGIEPSQIAQLIGWLHAHGVHTDSLDAESIETLLSPGVILPPQCRRVIEIRALVASASVKKLFAMENQACADNRLRDLIVHHGARTGRPTAEGPQPFNLPRAGPDLYWCTACGGPFGTHRTDCPWCLAPAAGGKPPRKWSHEAVDIALSVIASRSLDVVEAIFGDALAVISGCLRGLFVAGPGCDLIASDFSSIEAVVTAVLAGCPWRIEAFRNNEPIYLLSASKITGRPLQYYLDYKAATGDHHPDRQKIGKVNELANGYGGWIGASRNFGSTDPDDVIKAQILAWRGASPEIPEMWGGQWRGTPWDGRPELYGFEGCAIQAIQHPGLTFSYAGIGFAMRGEALIITLLSGRELTYHNARLVASSRPTARPGELAIWYMTWNTNPKMGAPGWVPANTYGGKLTENIVQAVAHDILRFSITQLRAAGYPTVLHVYDEIVAEIPQGAGSIEEFERIMAIMPPWAHDWPIRAVDGWRGYRYRKG